MKSFTQHGSTLLASLALLCLCACGKETEQAPEPDVKYVRLFTVESSDLLRHREYPGQAEAVQTADVAFRVSGPLVELPAQAGQQVRQGDVLAKIDPRDFQTQVKNIESSLKEAQAQWDAMKAGARPEDIRRLEAQLAARQASFDEVDTRHKRYQKLFADKVISQQEYDAVKKELDVADSQLENARQELEIGRKGARQEDLDAQRARVEGLQAKLDEARHALEDTVLTAPFDGVVAKTFVENFEDVRAQEPILRIQDISQIQITIQIPEQEMAQGLSQGHTAEELKAAVLTEVTFAALPGRTFEARLQKFETEADPQTQTFEITLVMDQPDDRAISPGMNALARGKGPAAAGQGGQFLVPSAAIFADSSGQPNVWLVDPQTQHVAPHPVQTGKAFQKDIMVTSGLQAGQVIAVTAAHTLREGMKVAPLPNLGEM